MIGRIAEERCCEQVSGLEAGINASTGNADLQQRRRFHWHPFLSDSRLCLSGDTSGNKRDTVDTIAPDTRWSEVVRVLEGTCGRARKPPVTFPTLLRVHRRCCSYCITRKPTWPYAVNFPWQCRSCRPRIPIPTHLAASLLRPSPCVWYCPSALAIIDRLC